MSRPRVPVWLDFQELFKLFVRNVGRVADQRVLRPFGVTRRRWALVSAHMVEDRARAQIGMTVHWQVVGGRASALACLLLMDQDMTWREAMASVTLARPGRDEEARSTVQLPAKSARVLPRVRGLRFASHWICQKFRVLQYMSTASAASQMLKQKCLDRIGFGSGTSFSIMQLCLGRDQDLTRSPEFRSAGILMGCAGFCRQRLSLRIQEQRCVLSH